jgi:hypothetical protein
LEAKFREGPDTPKSLGWSGESSGWGWMVVRVRLYS